MRLSAAVLAFLLLAPAACKRGAPSEPPEIVLLHQREEAMLRAEGALKQLDRDMDGLRAKAEKLKGRARVEAQDALSALEEKKVKVKLKMEELKTSSQDAARELVRGLEAAARDLEDSAKDAAARLK